MPIAEGRRLGFSYSRLPEQLLRLSVLKLDGSSFDVDVGRSATVEGLKAAVEGLFDGASKEWGEKISCFISSGMYRQRISHHIIRVLCASPNSRARQCWKQKAIRKAGKPSRMTTEAMGTTMKTPPASMKAIDGTLIKKISFSIPGLGLRISFGAGYPTQGCGAE